jgi:hypothetical protein
VLGSALALAGASALGCAGRGHRELIGTAAPVAWWTWLSRTLPHDAEAGGGSGVDLPGASMRESRSDFMDAAW